MKNKDLINACTYHDCDHCGCGKECNYFKRIYNCSPIVVRYLMRNGIDVTYGLKKMEGEPHKVSVPVKLDEEWLESEVMESEKS